MSTQLRTTDDRPGSDDPKPDRPGSDEPGGEQPSSGGERLSEAGRPRPRPPSRPPEDDDRASS